MSLYDYTALYKWLSLFQGSFLIGSAVTLLVSSANLQIPQRLFWMK